MSYGRMMMTVGFDVAMETISKLDKALLEGLLHRSSITVAGHTRTDFSEFCSNR